MTGRRTGPPSVARVRARLAAFLRPARRGRDAVADEPLSAPIHEPQAPLHGLLAEDNSTNQFVTLSILANAGIALDIVANGAAAVAAVKERHYDFVLMDVHMPEMDGLTATRAIRALEEPAASVPIVAVTANIFQEDVASCRLAGMDAVVTKPFRSRELVATIRGVARCGPVAAEDQVRPAESGIPALEELARDLGAEAIRPLVALFLSDAAARIAAIGGALSYPDTDFARAQMNAHALKSAAGQVGASALSELALRCEKAVAEADMRAARSALQAMRPALGVFRAAADARGLLDEATGT